MGQLYKSLQSLNIRNLMPRDEAVAGVQASTPEDLLDSVLQPELILVLDHLMIHARPHPAPDFDDHLGSIPQTEICIDRLLSSSCHSLGANHLATSNRIRTTTSCLRVISSPFYTPDMPIPAYFLLLWGSLRPELTSDNAHRHTYWANRSQSPAGVTAHQAMPARS